MSSSKYRSRSSTQRVIALSISYQREALLARGLGLEHLRELLMRLARPMVRHDASLAYGGHWRDTEDNFTFDLLQLISAEREDNSLGGPDTNLTIGRLYNHCAWPNYLSITPQIEAQWINCCRVVRITQQMAGIDAGQTVSDTDIASGAEAKGEPEMVALNSAISLSAMRRLALDPLSIDVPEQAQPELVPGICARVMLGGKLTGFSGFMPGLFEEALVSLERNSPLYVLGGFGGAAEALAHALLDASAGPGEMFTLAWHVGRNPRLAQLVELLQKTPLPASVRDPEDLFRKLRELIGAAARKTGGVGCLAQCLRTGLNEAHTRELLVTRDTRRAVQLVRQGLGALGLVPPEP